MTKSFWMEKNEFIKLEQLYANLVTEVCIIGGGVAGLTTAYLLGQHGKNVVLIDDGPIAGGQTARTTAHLSNEIDDRYIEIIKIHGKEKARKVVRSHAMAIDLIEKISMESENKCYFSRVNGYLFNPLEAETKDKNLLFKELKACNEAGFDGVHMTGRAPIENFNTGPALVFPNQGQIDILEYMHWLVVECKRLGVKIYTNAHASQIEDGPEPIISTEKGYKIKCKAVLVATNSPVNLRFSIHTKQAPYITYVVATKIKKGSIVKALYWDTLDSYHYVRIQEMPDHDVLIVGGEDHKTGQANDGVERWLRLIAWTKKVFQPARDSKFEYRWSGQVMETIDGLAFIGRVGKKEDNTYIITGDSGMGITHGTLGGIIISDLIMDKENPFAEVYDPNRKPVNAIKTYFMENLNVAKKFFFPKKNSSLEEIKLDSGGVFDKVAVYRDQNGKLQKLSAVCPHMKCIVSFNNAEKTWDCPCHGSRFTHDGQVINGPANENLKKEE